jgi:hypothetical protein
LNTRFVADGEWRLRTSERFRARERELHLSICTRYAEQLAGAGFWRRCLIRMMILIEFRRERRRTLPSRGALYLTSR